MPHPLGYSSSPPAASAGSAPVAESQSRRPAMPRPRRDDEMILRIARMRYEDRLPQMEIARQLGLSEATVSRCLKAAMDLGFVEIRVTSRGLRDTALEEQLARRFGLARAIVVRTGDTEAETRAVLGEAVARIVEDMLEPGTIVGVSDGDTVAEVAYAIRRGRSTGIDIVTLVGGVGRAEERSHSSQVARAMGSGTGGRVWLLPVPAVVDTPDMAQTLRNLSSVRDIFGMMERLSLAVFGIGDVSSHATLFRHGVVSLDHLRDINAGGAAGTVCARFFDEAGRPVLTGLDARTMSIPQEALLRAPTRLAVAIGAHKDRAIQAALKGGIVNALGTDTATARILLQAR